LAIACDVMLDLLRYEDDILNLSVVMQEYDSFKNQKRAYKLDDLYKRVKPETLKQIMKLIFKLVIKARS